MYNKNYYPTPKAIIEQMIAPYLDGIKKMNILEPSAGMGAILDYLSGWNVGVQKTRLYACEIDQNMKATVTGKGYKVIQDDFLNYSGAMNFDLIVMNPPFDAGEHHLLHAWEILRDGHIVCLLNEDTIKNHNSVFRIQLGLLIEEHGSVEYLGPAFETADRRTKVNVAMVRLQKTSAQSEVKFNGTGSATVDEINLDSTESSIEKRDYIASLTRAYQMAINSTRDMYTAMMEFNTFVGAFCSTYDSPKLMTAFFETSRKSGFSDAHNEFAIAFQKHAWNKIFSNTKASGLMTQKVREKFEKWREEMGGIDLNKENIMMLFDALIQQRKVIADECIVDAFDKIASYAERKAPGEKWKTNSLFMVPEKFILPWIVENNKYGGGLSIYHRAHDFLNDIDRAFCLISGKSFPVYGASKEEETVFIKTTLDAIQKWCRDKNEPQESEFFEFKCHIKGTVHFKVKDHQILAEFNRRACAAKGYVLPDEEMFRGKARRDQKVK